MSQCTATSKQSGERCRRAATPGRSVCVSHGSKSRRGAVHYNFKDGRYSKSLPARLVAQYAATLADPNLLALTAEISLTDARLDDLVRRVDSGESGATWRTLHETLTAFKAAQARGETSEARYQLSELDRVMTRGLSDEVAWADVRAMMEQRRKLVESKRKRLVEAQYMVNVAEVMVLVQALTTAVRRHVQDPEAINAIVSEIEQLVNWEASRHRAPERFQA